MSHYVRLFIAMGAVLAGGPTSFAQDTTLSKALANIRAHPPDGMAVAGTFVRALYRPQAIQNHLAGEEFRLDRTTVSEVLIDQRRARESSSDARKGQGGDSGDLRQAAFHYVNDGKRSLFYDSRNQKGSVLKSRPAPPQGRIAAVLSPLAAQARGNIMCRSTPTVMDRLSAAIVISEEPCETSGGPGIRITGRYDNADPAVSFEMTVMPLYHYAIKGLVEKDKRGRVLTQVDNAGFAQVGNIGYPKSNVLMVYRYDDYEGDTVQKYTMTVANLRTVPVTDADFPSLMPKDAKSLYDATIDTDVAKLDADLKAFLSERMESVDIGDREGNAIVARARERIRQDPDLKDVPVRPPIAATASPRTRWWLLLFLPFACCAVVLLVLRRASSTGRRCRDKNPARSPEAH